MSGDLSVVLPALDAAATVARAIGSVLAVEPDAEVVVVDDGSTDGTGAVAAACGPQVRVVRRPAPSGCGAARNHGLVVASRPLIGFLDADDEWCGGSPDPRLALLRSDPGVGIAVGHTLATVPGAGGPVPVGDPFLLLHPDAAIVRRSVLPRIGAFAEGLPGGEDLDWCLRARDAGVGFTVVEDTVRAYRMGPRTMSSDPAARRRNLLLATHRAIARRRGRAAASGPYTVSVVLPVRDGGDRLDRCLDSIAAQTRPVLEVLVIVGDSTDDTDARAAARAAADPRIRVVDRTGPALADAYNTGIGLARGDVVMFLAHDDEWFPGAVESLVGAIEGSPTVDHAHGRVLIAADADVPVGGAVRTELVGQVRAPRLPENLAARRSLFSTVGGFRTDRSTAADVDWHARAMDAGVGHAFVDDVVLRRVLRADSTSNSDTNSRAANAGLLASLHASIQRRRGAP